MLSNPWVRRVIYVSVVFLAVGTVVALPYGKLNWKVLAQPYGDGDGGKKAAPERFFDCAKDPTKWNPYEGTFQRRFIKWCEPWTDQDPTKVFPAVWEVQFHGLTCAEAAEIDSSVMCDYSEELP